MKTDVVVMGGGVAGSASAFFLAMQGLQVVVVDKTRFPRDKICTSTVNPYAMTYLMKMGVMKELMSDGMIPIEGMQGYSYEGTSYRGYYEPHYPFVNFGHTIPRYRLDAALSNRIKQLPQVTLLEDWAVEEVITDHSGRAIGVRGNHKGHSASISADFVIDAAGRGSIVARENGLFEMMRDHERYAVVCQYEGVKPPYPLFTIGTDETIGPGYFCIFPVTDSVSIVGFILDPQVFSTVKPDPAGWVDAFVQRDEWVVREWLSSARRASDVVAFGPLAFTTKQITRNGILMVGDTTGFFDPLTGEGIGMAIRSGELAAQTVARLLGGGANWEQEHALYEQTFMAEKAESLEQSRQMHRMLKRPAAYNRFVEALSHNQEAANWAARSFANMLPPGERVSGRLFELVTSKQ
ncbi:NAD(P)/FAD-dependent oxidoreductase [Brevibacillus humidisoli]|uniref:NAD(P)/FAD-dependent oxidoreductase n=1 Tax=Brevibacillus humidisoli TaxID=2895522 RepID=UPI001E43C22D|nr:NAD(P)/FAD-dependent oxidoreductase [Brevibacillus humidisoli]UFJ42569.1 NAD(P)/FAD-dependent oxidoreductase [Brevibacillus humidisoli]